MRIEEEIAKDEIDINTAEFEVTLAKNPSFFSSFVSITLLAALSVDYGSAATSEVAFIPRTTAES